MGQDTLGHFQVSMQGSLVLWPPCLSVFLNPHRLTFRHDYLRIAIRVQQVSEPNPAFLSVTSYFTSILVEARALTRLASSSSFSTVSLRHSRSFSVAAIFADFVPYSMIYGFCHSLLISLTHPKCSATIVCVSTQQQMVSSFPCDISTEVSGYVDLMIGKPCA